MGESSECPTQAIAAGWETHKMAALITVLLIVLCFPLEALSGQLKENTRILSDKEKTIIAGAVKDILKDPDSVKFRWYEYNGYSHYCGMLNAKNSYGGYVGFRNYYVDTDLDNGGIIVGAHNPRIINEDDKLASVFQDVCLIAARGGDWKTSPPKAVP